MRHLLSALLSTIVTMGCAADTPRASPEAASPTPSAVPSARAVDVSGLLRTGTTSERTEYGDMNGVAPEEIAVHSQDTKTPEGSTVPRSYIDVFAYDPGRSRWVKVFDAGSYPARAADPVLRAPEQFVSQSVQFMEFVDFARDSRPELVLGVQSFGASLGPLDLWVLSWNGEAFSTDVKVATGRGGTPRVSDNRVVLEAPEYKPDDPGCCPSGTATQVIGYDAGARRVRVLSKTVAPTSPQPS